MIALANAALLWVTAFALVNDFGWLVGCIGISVAILFIFQRRHLSRLLQGAVIFISAATLLVVSFAFQNSGSQYFSDAVANYETAEATFTVQRETQVSSSVARQSGKKYLITVTQFGLQENLKEQGDLSASKATLEVSGSYRAMLQLIPLTNPSKSSFRAVVRSEPQLLALHDQVDVFAAAKRAFISNLRAFSSDSAALVAGLAIGADNGLSQQVKVDMKTVSLTHLTAVSGANCAIVVGAVFLLVRRLSIRKRAFVAGCALTAYVLLVGPEPSVLRSAAMAYAVLLALAIGRRVKPVVALSLAICALLVFDPWLSVSFGFALSVFATIGILELAPLIYTRLKVKMPSWLALGVSVTAAAQLLCLPVLLQLQPGLATFSILANLLAEPIVAPVTILGIVAVCCAWFAPWLAQIITLLASLGTNLIVEIAKFLAGQPLATVSWLPSWLGVLAAVFTIALIFSWFRAETIRIRNLATLGLACAIAITLSSATDQVVRSAVWPPSDWSVVNCDVGQGDALVIRSAEQFALIDTSRDERAIDQCLNRLGVEHIDLLVLTHFDFDHVGATVSAIDHRQLGSVILTPFVDERPEARFIKGQIKRRSNAVFSGEVGLSGRLGLATWRVLSPHHLAEEAEDSNDASVTMLFEFSDFYLLCLADVGERGQMRIANETSTWLASKYFTKPLVLKVSHHGSADQYPEFIEALEPAIALISVGEKNGYGHPTQRTLDLLARSNSIIGRTDKDGSLAIVSRDKKLSLIASG